MVAVLLNAGDHVPVMPLLEVVGNVIAGVPLHIAGMAVKVGVIWLVITMSMVTTAPHCPASGVNVYVAVPVVAVLIVAGLQVPVMLLLDVNGNNGAVEFWQSGPINVNTGVIWLVITISMATGAAH